MQERITVKPVEGRIVRFPENRAQILQNEGESVEKSPYWRRRLKGGDVQIVTVETPPKKREKKEE